MDPLAGLPYSIAQNQSDFHKLLMPSTTKTQQALNVTSPSGPHSVSPNGRSNQLVCENRVRKAAPMVTMNPARADHTRLGKNVRWNAAMDIGHLCGSRARFVSRAQNRPTSPNVDSGALTPRNLPLTIPSFFVLRLGVRMSVRPTLRLGRLGSIGARTILRPSNQILAIFR